jgi:glycosyltransferase 2 family protein
MYYVATYFLCQSVAIGEQLSFLAVLTILVMGSVAMAIPTMGGIGSYHLLVGKIVVLYGLSNQEGISLATFLHSMQGLLFVIVFGAIAFILSFLSSKKSI